MSEQGSGKPTETASSDSSTETDAVEEETVAEDSTEMDSTEVDSTEANSTEVDSDEDNSVKGDSSTEKAPETTEIDKLETLIAENPAEISRLLERLGLLNELLDATDIATSAMDDEMVTSLAGTGTNLAMAADGMATEETVELGSAVGHNATDLAAGVESIAELQRTGTLDDLVELAEIVSLATGALDDEMVMSLTSTGARLGELADTAADDDVASGLENVLTALGEATSEEPDKIGMVGLLKALRDPDVQAGLGVVIALSSALGQAMTEDDETEL